MSNTEQDAAAVTQNTKTVNELGNTIKYLNEDITSLYVKITVLSDKLVSTLNGNFQILNVSLNQFTEQSEAAFSSMDKNAEASFKSMVNNASNAFDSIINKAKDVNISLSSLGGISTALENDSDGDKKNKSWTDYLYDGLSLAANLTTAITGGRYLIKGSKKGISAVREKAANFNKKRKLKASSKNKSDKNDNDQGGSGSGSGEPEAPPKKVPNEGGSDREKTDAKIISDDKQKPIANNAIAHEPEATSVTNSQNNKKLPITVATIGVVGAGSLNSGNASTHTLPLEDISTEERDYIQQEPDESIDTTKLASAGAAIVSASAATYAINKKVNRTGKFMGKIRKFGTIGVITSLFTAMLSAPIRASTDLDQNATSEQEPLDDTESASEQKETGGFMSALSDLGSLAVGFATDIGLSKAGKAAGRLASSKLGRVAGKVALNGFRIARVTTPLGLASLAAEALISSDFVQDKVKGFFANDGEKDQTQVAISGDGVSGVITQNVDIGPPSITPHMALNGGSKVNNNTINSNPNINIHIESAPEALQLIKLQHGVTQGIYDANRQITATLNQGMS